MAAVVLPLRYGLTQSDLEDRLSRDELVAVMDDNNDGAPDTNPVNRVLADAISFVEGAAGQHYSLNTMRLVSPAPNELIRLILDAAEWMCCKRHPEVVRSHAWDKLREINRQDITDWAKGMRRLDTEGPPEPSKTQGGTTVQDIGNPTEKVAPPKFFDDFGDY